MFVFVLMLCTLLVRSVICDMKMNDPVYPVFSIIDYELNSMFSSMAQFYSEEKCKITSAWFLMRHGAKYPSSDILKDINDNLINKIQPALKELYGNKDSNFITLHDNVKLIIERLLSWNNPIDTGSHKDLNHQGISAMKKLGQNMNAKLKPLTTLKYNEVEVLTSEEKRCVDSAKYFLSEFFETNYIDIDVNVNLDGNPRLKLVKINEEEIKLKDEKPDGTISSIYVEDKYFKLKSPEITKRIKNLLFPSYIIGYEQYQNLITNDDVKTMYYACVYGNYAFDETNNEQGDAWCLLFRFKDFKMFEDMHDLQYYYKNGYYNNYNATVGNALVEDILRFLKQPDGLKFKLFTGHTSNCLSIYTRFKLFKDNVELNIDNIEYMYNRKWRTSFISPFLCNVLIVVYDCNVQHFRVTMYINDDPITMVLSNEFGEFSCVKCPLDEFVNLLISFNLRDKPLDIPLTEVQKKKKEKKKNLAKQSKMNKMKINQTLHEAKLKEREKSVLLVRNIYEDIEVDKQVSDHEL